MISDDQSRARQLCVWVAARGEELAGAATDEVHKQSRTKDGGRGKQGGSSRRGVLAWSGQSGSLRNGEASQTSTRAARQLPQGLTLSLCFIHPDETSLADHGWLVRLWSLSRFL